MLIELASTVLLFVAFLAFAAKRSLTYMHAYQQEEYDSDRLIGWIWKHKTFDKRLSLLIVIITVASLWTPAFITNFLLFAAMTVIAYLEKDPRTDSKKKLIPTARARRIFFPAYILIALSGLWCFVPMPPMPAGPLIWIVNIHMIPLMLMLVNLALSPIEEINQKKFWNEAHSKVREYKPTVIGITGSFGKTSVKHILGHILKTQAPTLITPGSVNTPMGITRIIREELEPEHEYLIVEMGAYGKGSIERLCRLTPPNFGIITAIGHAHYERFKSLDTVAETKYELAEAVLANNGKTIVHERTLRFEHTHTFKELHANHLIVCGQKVKDIESFLEDGDAEILSITQSPNGLNVQIKWKNQTHTLETPLFGLHHGHNIALAFVSALELGVSVGDIQAALRSLPQISHRLEVKKQPGNFTIIDDAYNSNPVGFQSALGLLGQLGKSGRKILITPGMVELGQMHNDAHRTLGTSAGEICDVAIIVQGKRIPTFIEGFKQTGNGKTLHEVDSFAEAEQWITKNQQSGDVILIENDLPDIYERVPKI